MTREEAVERFQRMKKILSIPNSDAARTIEAISMAIEALKQEPSREARMTREEAIIQLRLGPGINEDVSEEYNDAVNIAIDALEQEPIIHCKDCKKWVNGDDRYGICNWNEYCTLQTAKDGFCSCGKRRDE